MLFMTPGTGPRFFFPFPLHVFGRDLFGLARPHIPSPALLRPILFFWRSLIFRIFCFSLLLPVPLQCLPLLARENRSFFPSAFFPAPDHWSPCTPFFSPPGLTSHFTAPSCLVKCIRSLFKAILPPELFPLLLTCELPFLLRLDTPVSP